MHFRGLQDDKSVLEYIHNQKRGAIVMLKSPKSPVKFVITVTMECGEIWETIRHTKAGMQAVIEDVLADAAVISFTVEERV